MTTQASATEVAVPENARGLRWAAAVLRTARPRQWPKNLLVFAAPLAGATTGRPGGLAYAAAAFVAFGCASASVYYVNDVMDVEADVFVADQRRLDRGAPLHLVGQFVLDPERRPVAVDAKALGRDAFVGQHRDAPQLVPAEELVVGGIEQNRARGHGARRVVVI